MKLLPKFDAHGVLMALLILALFAIAQLLDQIHEAKLAGEKASAACVRAGNGGTR